MFWPNFLLLFLVVVACCSWLLLVVPGCCCLFVPVGACWCLLVPVGGACWWCLLVFVVCVCVVGVFKIFGPLPRTVLPLDRPKFRSFCSLSRPKFLSFLLSLGVFSWKSWCFSRPGPEMCTFGLSGCRVKPQTGPPGLHTTTRTSKRAHLSVPALQTPPKFHEKTPREIRKNEISGKREQKKREILGLPPFGPHPSGPHPPCPHQKQNWPNAVWPTSVNKNWPNSAK